MIIQKHLADIKQTVEELKKRVDEMPRGNLDAAYLTLQVKGFENDGIYLPNPARSPFRGEYETLWISDERPDTTSLMQVKLVLALGAVTYNDRFSLRASAIQWANGRRSVAENDLHGPSQGFWPPTPDDDLGNRNASTTLEHHSRAPPGNFDDEQFEPHDADSRPEGHNQGLYGSDTLQNLSLPPCCGYVSKQFNHPGTYEETLRLDADLREAYRMLAQTL
ncbi:hypothetical protein KXX16_007288 [Aspergillus fumigatus]|nr:hypothetical protein KXX30_006278 [Aspergillus fumigatus]KAH1313543.1 hypothetical protein KXX66_007628 [Aspergillus fumigatus]KAH1315691.1 hypothetical protein KXX38_002548 [Aspergillus fumigatus]KAH1340013.1 hypothetical protein KXX14_006768 [Aspergillus fumigatus]KAH1351590.1 hypothetical protein KXX33_009451 [Aspergillus fumigatus]